MIPHARLILFICGLVAGLCLFAGWGALVAAWRGRLTYPAKCLIL